MKKLLLLCMSLSFAATTVFAQQNYVEGSLGINYSDVDESINLSINPNFGFMVSDHLAVGFGIYCNYIKNDTPTKTSEFGGDVFVQSFSKITDKFHYTPKLYLLIGGGNITYNQSNPNSYKTSYFGITGGVSIANFELMATPQIGLTFNFGGLEFGYAKMKNNETGYSTFGLNIFQTAQLGMRFHF